ncbi:MULTISPECIES: dipeptidase [Streptomyces]|uniref:dipeptidase n=1 Tax=Streptomyces TaxID=1883 RepID=UPI0004CD5B15|nr:dipeptidase [Streptomyces durhamensis]
MADLQPDSATTAEVGADDTLPDTPDAQPPCSAAVLEQAHALLAAHPVADGHSGLPSALRRLSRYDLELGEPAVDTDIPRLREGHVGALFWSLHLPEATGGDHPTTAALEQLDFARSVIDAHPEGLRLVHTAGEIIDARHRGRVAVVLGPAPATALDDSLAVLRVLRALGLHVLTLTGTAWAGEQGLNRFGEEVVREMNRIGVLADVSGAATATVESTLALSRTPVLCTRSAARALRPHPANLPDGLLAALGTARGLCLVPLTAEQTGPTVHDVADHLDHVRDMAGPDCVGLSGTYDTGVVHPRGLADASRYPHLIAELLRRGWSDTELSLLTWGNVQRVLRSAHSTARAAQHRHGPPPAQPGQPEGP